MESFGNEIRVQQGEDWSLDTLLSANSVEYIPYIVSSKLNNPAFVVTVVSTKFDKNMRYQKSWWNTVKNLLIPTFYSTQPIYCGELGASKTNWAIERMPNMPLSLLSQTSEERLFKLNDKVTDSDDGYGYGIEITDSQIRYQIKNDLGKGYIEVYNNVDGWVSPIYRNIEFVQPANTPIENWLEENAVNYGEDYLPTSPGFGTFAEYTKNDTKDTRYLYQYIKEVDEIDKQVGHKPYYYFYYKYEDTGEINLVTKYECRITFNFLSKDTQDWTGQNYMYQITLASGQLLADKLEEIRDYHEYLQEDVNDWPNDSALGPDELNKLRYEYVKTRWPDELQPDIDADSYLGYIETPVPILRPTKLEVLNNLRTII